MTKFALVSFDVRPLSSKPIRVLLLFYGSKTSKIENSNLGYAANQNEKVTILFSLTIAFTIFLRQSRSLRRAYILGPVVRRSKFQSRG